MYTIGYDIGSTKVKGVILHLESGKPVASASAPVGEMPITSPQFGWAEQHPRMWWENVKTVTHQLLSASEIDPLRIRAIGLAYQMHGLVVVDGGHHVLRPSIIWCDSRAVDIGKRAFDSLGHDRCLRSLLNSPGNFTASKLSWIRENEPEIFDQVFKAMLPGDYIAMRLTGEISTTVSGLSEGILWDFEKRRPAQFLLDQFGIDHDMIPQTVRSFGEQGALSNRAGRELGLPEGIPITYRAGDQPNNAFSLNALNHGEAAATAGSSGVVYAVSERIKCDRESRVNTFAHVNHSKENTSLGVLLCVNGTGIANQWLRKMSADGIFGLDRSARTIADVPVGSNGLVMLPFGNGAERMLGGRDLGAHLLHLNHNLHSDADLARAVLEGVTFAFKYGMEIMSELEIRPAVIRASASNLFLSDVFCSALSSATGIPLELYETDGAQGAATGAAVGLEYYPSLADAFKSLHCRKRIEPDASLVDAYGATYERWLRALMNIEELQRTS
ncbi:MAG: FGGY family carbohydrate kinase [Ignavibacteriales bacterium]|nr:FGGY family carbohydrate kinase [Ignavibacteriales bacterium]